MPSSVTATATDRAAPGRCATLQRTAAASNPNGAHPCTATTTATSANAPPQAAAATAGE
ncbi:hypothetical protein [Kitasatospora fiedleri]|uniref:hypothetical protein n=1 Tax=Kitasatospora fiedleri TaxID=2991545 RepID=UPI00249CE806|nr:hypothetical protein [Kitasatospora fiedleri]